MGLYNRYLLPRLINLAMQNRAARAERVRFVPLASGAILEVGIGSGLNLPFYAPGVARLYGVDPSPALLRMARRRAARASFPVALVEGSAEALPAADATCDAVVSTWTLCSIPDPAAALAEMARVLKPDGRLVFVEHGWSPDARVRAWQERLDPVWPRLAGGCHLNRKVDELIEGAGFRITRLETGYAAGVKPLAYLYRGLAGRPA